MPTGNLYPNNGVWDFRCVPASDDECQWTVAFHDGSAFCETSTIPIRFRDVEHAHEWLTHRIVRHGVLESGQHSLSGTVPAQAVGQLVNDLHFASCDEPGHSAWFSGAYSECRCREVDADEFDAGMLPRFAAPGFEVTDSMHVFVAHGDMRTIAADAYLVPTDSRPHVNAQWGWLWGAADESPALSVHEATAVRELRACAIRFAECTVVLANTAGVRLDGTDKAIEWLKDGLVAALDAYGETLGEPTPSRRRPVLAIPMLGTKGGDLARIRGRVAREILETLQGYARESRYSTRFDVILTLREAADYSAVQALRRPKSAGVGAERWLHPVINAACAGQLGVLFGAGASIPLGLPRWDELLRRIAKDLDLGASGEGLLALDPVDAASILRERAGSNEAFKALLEQHVSTSKASLMHVLLANLRPLVAITTNYDRGYELAMKAMKEDCAVLPWRQPLRPDQPRLLKLHGDIEHGSVVLSRDDFVTMHAHRRPLGSMLQERMLVGHMLVVGSSMSDPTLVQAAEEVSSLVREVNSEGAFGAGESGTIILTVDDPARRMLLRRSFTVAIGARTGEELGDGVRHVEILLDFIAMHAERRLGYLLQSEYQDLVVNPDLKALVLRLQELNDLVNQGGRHEEPLLKEFRHKLIEALEGF